MNRCAILAAGAVLFGAVMIPAIADDNLNEGHADGRGDLIRGGHRVGVAHAVTPEAVTPHTMTPQAVTQGNGISYHGGPVMQGITDVYYIWYGDWTQDAAANAILTDLANNIGGSAYFNINTTYGDTTGDVENSVFYVSSASDLGSLGTSLADNDIWTIVMNAISTGKLPLDANGVYFVLTAPGVKETSGFLTQYCGWHTYGTYNSTNVKFAFVGDAAGPSFGSCAAQTATSPNGDPAADAMASVISHELEESVTDPLLDAWYDSTGDENADKCAWSFGTTYAANGAMANMHLGNRDFLIQRNWLNAGGGRCALSYSSSSSTGDFSLSVSPGSQSVVKGSTSGNYTLTATPSNGFTGTVTWSVSPPSGITASPVSPSGTFTLTAGTGVAAGTYSIPITGTSGSLVHSTSASLVVISGSFTVSVSPSSRTVKRPISGSASTTYTVTVGGTVTSLVSLTVSGGATGIKPVLSPTTLQGTGQSTLTVTVTPSSHRTTRTLTVTATHGGKSKTAQATITVN
jgi:hypothetical protein